MTANTTAITPEVSYDLDAAQVAKYIISLDSMRPEPDVTQLKLQKLLFLAQANYLAATGRRLFSEQTEAFENGPVIDAIRRLFQSYGRKIIAPDSTAWNITALPADARRFVDSIWELYGDWSATALWKLTHTKGAPWDQYYRENSFHTVIPDDAIRDFYREDVQLKDRVLHPDVIAVDSELLDELDEREDEIVAKAMLALS